MAAFRNLVGHVFGYFVVIQPNGWRTANSGKRTSIWLCQCHCGKTAVYDASKIHSKTMYGGTPSCGCMKHKTMSDKLKKHGLRQRSEYRIWALILQRCNNKNNPAFDRYGGRGISVCERWHKFTAFYADVGPRPTPKHSIDRINNNGNYEPGNVRWATAAEQANNTRTSVVLTLGDRSMTASQWSLVVGISAKTIGSRKRRGWSDEDALTISLIPRSQASRGHKNHQRQP